MKRSTTRVSAAALILACVLQGTPLLAAPTDGRDRDRTGIFLFMKQIVRRLVVAFGLPTGPIPEPTPAPATSTTPTP